MQTNFKKTKKTKNKACDITFVGIGKIMKISSKNLTGISQYNGSLMAYIQLYIVRIMYEVLQIEREG